MERFKVFRNNLVRANELNELHLASGVHKNTPFGITKFSDLSTAEFSRKYLNNFNILQKARAALPDFKNLNIEKHKIVLDFCNASPK